MGSVPRRPSRCEPQPHCTRISRLKIGVFFYPAWPSLYYIQCISPCIITVRGECMKQHILYFIGNLSDFESSFFFFFLIIIYLFIYFWLCWVFVSVRGLSPVAASGGHSSSRCARRPLTIAAPLVAEHRLQTRRLSNCGSRARSLRGMWDPPRPGLEHVFPASAGRLPTTAPPGKPLESSFDQT